MNKQKYTLFFLIPLIILLYTCEDVDNTSPTVAITNPIHGSVIHEIVLIIISVSDNSTIKDVQLLINGIEFENLIKDNDTYKYSWVTGSLANGSQHTLLAKATDSEGNTGQSDIVTVSVNNEGYEPQSIILESPVINGSYITLQWSASNDADFDHYELLRSHSGIDTFSIVYSTSSSQNIVFTDSVIQNTSYEYYIKVIDVAGLFSESNHQIIEQSQFLPPIPQNFSVIVNGSFIELSWESIDIPDFGKYVILKNTSNISQIDSIVIQQMSKSSYSDSVSQFNEYEYSLITYDDYGNYVITDKFSFSLSDFQPQTPIMYNPTLNGSNISLTWSKNTDSDFLSYQIYRSQNGSGMELIRQIEVQDDTTLIDEVTQGLSYLYLITVDDNGGLQANSNTVSISATEFNPTLVQLISIDLSGDIITLTWNYSPDVDFSKFEIIRNNITVVQITNALENSYQEVVVQGQDYSYQVKVVDTAELEAISNTKTILANEFYPPSVEINNISYNGSGILIEWSPSDIPDFQAIKIIRSTDSLFIDKTIIETISDKNQDKYIDNSIQTENSRYFYKLNIYDTGNLSTISNWKYLSFFDEIMFLDIFDNNGYLDLILVEIDRYNARPIVLDVIGGGFDVSPDGKYAIARDNRNQQYLLVDILNETSQVIKDEQQWIGLTTIMWTSDSKKVYFFDAHQIFEYNVNSNSVTHIIGAYEPSDERIFQMYVSEGSGKVIYNKFVYWYGEEARDVFVYYDGTHENITNTGGDPAAYYQETNPIINYSGSTAYYVRNGIVLEKDLITNIETEFITAFGWLLPEAIFSRDDNNLYVTWHHSSGDYTYGLYDITMNDGTVTMMYDGKASLQDISADGEKILFNVEGLDFQIIMDRTTYQIEVQIPVTHRRGSRWVKNRWSSN